jgi:hypothetical protein
VPSFTRVGKGSLKRTDFPHGIHGLHIFLSGRDTDGIAQEEEVEPALTTSLVAKHREGFSEETAFSSQTLTGFASRMSIRSLETLLASAIKIQLSQTFGGS